MSKGVILYTKQALQTYDKANDQHVVIFYNETKKPEVRANLMKAFAYVFRVS